MKDEKLATFNKRLDELVAKGMRICSYTLYNSTGSDIVDDIVNGACHASLRHSHGGRYLVNANPNPNEYRDYVSYIVNDSPYKACFRLDVQTLDEMMKRGWIMDGTKVTARVLVGACIALRMVQEFQSICVWFEKYTKPDDSPAFKNIAFLMAHMLHQSASISLNSSSHQAINPTITIAAAQQFVFRGEPEGWKPFTEMSNYSIDGYTTIFDTWGGCSSEEAYGMDIVYNNIDLLGGQWLGDRRWGGRRYSADFSKLSIEQMRALIGEEVVRLEGIDAKTYTLTPPPDPDADKVVEQRPYWLNWPARSIGAVRARDEYDRLFGFYRSRRFARFEDCLPHIHQYYRDKGLY